MPFEHQFLNSINLNGNQIIGATAEQLASEPAGKADGYWYYNTTTNKFQFKENGAYLPIGDTTLQNDADPTLGNPLDTNAHAIQESIGTNIASQTTLPITNNGNYYTVTGSSTITGIAATYVGLEIELNFAGVLQLTHNGTSFILPSATNITTAAGDVAKFREISSGNWKCTRYTRADGTSLVGSGGSAPFTDISAHIKNDADATKLIRFDASNITTGNTRVLQAPDTNAKLALVPFERSYYTGGGSLVQLAYLDFTVFKRAFTIVDIHAQVADGGTVDAVIQLWKNNASAGTNITLDTAANFGTFVFGAQTQANISFAAGDVCRFRITEEGDNGGSGATAAVGPLDILVLGHYAPD